MKSFSDIIELSKKYKKKAKLVLAPADDRGLLRLFSSPLLSDSIEPLLIGDIHKTNELLHQLNIPSDNLNIINIPDAKEALLKAVSMVNEGNVDIMMQGNVKNPLFRDIVFDENKGIMIDSILSHISLIENCKTNRVIMITDTMINSSPTLKQKCTILENAILLAEALGIKRPKAAVIAALEYINPLIPSTTDAAIISKMGERHQFGDVVVDGPLDIDCAVSREASSRKSVSSPVTERSDIFLVTDVESGYCFAHVLSFIGRMPMAGIIVGARVPIVLNMPYITPENKIVEIAIAKLLCQRQK